MRLAVSIFISLFSLALSAHPSENSHITGTDIELSTRDHSFAGRIRTHIVLGSKLHKQNKSEFSFIVHDQKETVTYDKADLPSFDAVLEVYDLKVNGTVYKVKLSYDRIENGHFINPRFATDVKGKEVFFLVEGASCKTYSAHLVSMILGSYLAQEK